MNLQRLLWRSWYYLRIGYSVYLTFILGFVSTIVTVYYLAVNNISFLKSAFPNFWLFGVLALVIGVPLAVLLGYFHFKRSQAFTSEVDVSAESNPYNWKVIGKEREVYTAMWAIMLHALATGKITPTMMTQAQELEEKLWQLHKKGDYRQKT